MSEPTASCTHGAAASSSSQDGVQERNPEPSHSHVSETLTEDELKDVERDIIQPFEGEAEVQAGAAADAQLLTASGEFQSDPSADENNGGEPVDRVVMIAHEDSHGPPIKFSKPGGSIFTVRQSKDDLSKDFALNLLPNMHREQLQIDGRKDGRKEKEHRKEEERRNQNDRRTSEVSALPTSRRQQRASTVAGLTGGGERRQRSCSFALNSVSAHSTISQIQSIAEKAGREGSSTAKDENIQSDGKKQRERSCSFALNSVANHSTMQQIQQIASQNSHKDTRLSKSQTQPALDHTEVTKGVRIERSGSEASSDSSDATSSSASESGQDADVQVKSVRILGDDGKAEPTNTAPAHHASIGGEIVRRLSRMLPMGGFFETAQQPETIQEEPTDGEAGVHKPKRRFSRAINATVQAAIHNEHDEGDETHLPWIFTSRANTFFGLLIVVNAGWMGAETDHVDRLPDWFWVIGESMFLLMFGIEIILRYKYHNRMPLGIDEEPMTFFRYVWNVLDLIIVVSGIIDTWIMTLFVKGVLGVSEAGSGGFLSMLQLLRILRLLRIIRIFRFLKDLVLLAQGIYSAIKGLQGAAILLAMTLYIFSIFATRFLGQFRPPDGESPPEGAELLEAWFGTVHESLFTLFQMSTLENWHEVARLSMRVKGWPTAFFFIGFIIITHFVLLNLVTGVILENVMAISRREEEKALQREEAVRIQTVMKIHRLFDAVLGQLHSGELSIEEFRQACLNPRVVRQLQDLQIATHEAEELFVLMDTSKRGCIDIDHFIEGCLRIRGVARAKHLLGVQYDVQKVWSKLSEQLDEVEDRLMECLEVLLEESEERSEMRASTRGSQSGHSRGSVDRGVQRVSARRSGALGQGRGSVDREAEAAYRRQAEASQIAQAATVTVVPGPAAGVPATAAVGIAAADPAAGVASPLGSSAEEVMSNGESPLTASQQLMQVVPTQPDRSSSKRSRRRGSTEETSGKLSTSSLPGAMMDMAEAEQGTLSGRSNEFANMPEARLKKARTQGHLKKSWSKTGDLAASEASLDTEQLNAEKALAEKAMAKLMALQREEERLRGRLEKVQQARETELLALQRYFTLDARSPKQAVAESTKVEEETSFSAARSMPSAGIQPVTLPMATERSLSERPNLPLQSAREGAPSPVPLEGAGPSLARQRRVSLGGEKLQAPNLGEMTPGRRLSVAHPGATSMRRPSMGLGLIDTEATARNRRISVAHGVRSLAERHSTIEHENEDEESEHESSEAPSEKES